MKLLRTTPNHYTMLSLWFRSFALWTWLSCFKTLWLLFSQKLWEGSLYIQRYNNLPIYACSYQVFSSSNGITWTFKKTLSLMEVCLIVSSRWEYFQTSRTTLTGHSSICLHVTLFAWFSELQWCFNSVKVLVLWLRLSVKWAMTSPISSFSTSCWLLCSQQSQTWTSFTHLNSSKDYLNPSLQLLTLLWEISISKCLRKSMTLEWGSLDSSWFWRVLLPSTYCS